ncbi:MAG: hypothetical protein ABSH20_14330 [Tepidisphaeraceae bacterium]
MPRKTPTLRASVLPCLRAFVLILLAATSALAGDPAVDKLREEVATKGWILFSAKTTNGDYDLFLSRPDGSAKRSVTQTPEWSEYGGRFSPDSKRILYRRLKKGAEINHDLWGARGELVVADADGSNPVVFGDMGEYPWASWSPDGTQFACLYRREGIQIIDIASKKVVKQLPRRGIFQQLYWSPDGKRLVGTANVGGQSSTSKPARPPRSPAARTARPTGSRAIPAGRSTPTAPPASAATTARPCSCRPPPTAKPAR